MKVISHKMMFLLEEGVDFTCEDVQQTSESTQHLTHQYKTTFLNRHGFDHFTQQFPVYKGRSGKLFAQVECEKRQPPDVLFMTERWSVL